MALNDRQLSLILWIFVLLLFMLSTKDMRGGVAGLVKYFFVAPILAVLALVCTYVALCVWVLAALGLWSAANLVTTLAWLFSFAFVAVFAANRIKEERVYFKQVLRDSVGAAAFFLFIAEFATFSLWIEIVLMGLGFFFGAMAAFAAREARTQNVAQFAQTIVALIVFAYLVNGAWGAFRDLPSFLSVETLREFIVPLALTIGFLPFIFALLRYMSVESFVKTAVPFAVKDPTLRNYAIAQALLRYNLDEANLGAWRRELHVQRPRTRADIDDIAQKLRTQRRRRARPPTVDSTQGWSPYAVIDFLEAQGLKPNDWHESYGVWCADTPLIALDDDRFGGNTIAYYIEGDELVAKRLTLRLYVNNRDEAAEVERQFRSAAAALVRAALPFEGARLAQRLADVLDFDDCSEGRRVTLSQEAFKFGDPPGYQISLTLDAPANS